MNKELMEKAIKAIGQLVNEAHNVDCEEKDNAVKEGWEVLEQLIKSEGTDKFKFWIEQ
ncbi:hypothetical protein ACIGIJ_19115 [Bacillus paranthracis]|uniref:hypothetical protein n=1 Tax=Bacillus paranthracis TaxID=2026186 RepID=UPI0037C5EE85